MERVNIVASHIAQNETSSENQDAFGHLKLAPPDVILGTAVAYRNDPDANKCNLGVGAYRDDNEKPYVFEIVRQAQKEIVDEKLDKEYLPIEGHAGFNKAAQNLIFGDHQLSKEGKILTIQTISGTGALRVGFEAIKIFIPGDIYYSDPTWANHIAIIEKAGLTPKKYTYYNAKTKSLDFDGMCQSLEGAKPGSVVLLHVCAHNPTGVDPTADQWRILAKLMKAKKLFPFFDSAYQGFATGDLIRDSQSIHIFLEEGHQMFVAQSLSKNMGLYGERIGALHVVCKSKETAEKVLSQINLIIRPMYSNPPSNGARIAFKILTKPEYRAKWDEELKQVSGRIISMRRALFEELNRLQVPGNWDHIINQIGMFSYTGLTPEQCDVLINKHHIYLIRNGRISMCGVTTKNAKYIAKAIQDAVVNTPKTN
jgi:aspartate/tyrosine/aromatic aminotransferase